MRKRDGHEGAPWLYAGAARGPGAVAHGAARVVQPVTPPGGADRTPFIQERIAIQRLQELCRLLAHQRATPVAPKASLALRPNVCPLPGDQARTGAHA